MNEAVARELHDRLWRFVRGRLSSAVDADDVTQQVFVRMLARIGQLEDDRSVHAWAYRIARHAVADHYRRAGPAPVLDADVEGVAAPPPEALDPRRDIAACLAPLLDHLSAPQREAVVLTDVGGMSQAAAAASVGVSPSGMRSRVQRGRKELRTQLEACCRFEFDGCGRVMDYESTSSCCP